MSEFHVYGSDMMNAMMVLVFVCRYVDVGAEDRDARHQWSCEEAVTCSADHQRGCQGGNGGEKAGAATNGVRASGGVSGVPAAVRAM